MKIFKIFVVLALCTKGFGLYANTLHKNIGSKHGPYLNNEKKWQSTTVFSAGFTTGAFSQQYYQYLRTEVANLFFWQFKVKYYEHSVQRYNYYLPSVSVKRTYSKSNFTNLSLNLELHQGVANSTTTKKAVTLFTSRFNFNKKYFGLGLGMTFGNSLFKDNVYVNSEEKMAQTNYENSRFITELRLGRLDIIYFETSRMNPVTLDDVDYSYGIGTGFGSMNKFALRIGRYDKYINTGTYAEFRLPIGKNTFLNMYGGYVNKIKRTQAVVPGSEKYNEIYTNSWYTGFKMNWYL